MSTLFVIKLNELFWVGTIGGVHFLVGLPGAISGENPIPTNANLIFLGSSTLSLLRLGDRSERRPTVYALEGCRTLIVVSSVISMRSRSHFGHVSGIPPTLVARAHNKRIARLPANE
uniref:Uncharacterized protein n=1 Tax=Oryza rufipogon TaxID=4529 RepID=A0A0E0PQN8_ORYRU